MNAPATIAIVSANENLKTSQNGLEFISKWEGCILKPYKDVAGLRTIGIGHLIKPGENFQDGVAISMQQAYDLLAKDLSEAEAALKKNAKVALNQNQFDALVSFGFNCGTSVYVKSGAMASVNAGDFSKVPTQLLDWSKARVNGTLQVVTGLYNRRKSEGELFMRPTAGAILSGFPVPWTKDTLIEAQTLLKKLGYYTLAVDGLWGPGSSKAVSDFSAYRGVALGDPSKGVSTDFMDELKKAAS